MNPSWIRRKAVRSTNKSQYNFLIKEMQQHPGLTTVYPIQNFTRVEYGKLWIKIAEQLNALGPPHKSIKDWKRVWSHIKGRLRLRMRKRHGVEGDVIDALRELQPDHDIDVFFSTEIEEIDEGTVTETQIELLEYSDGAFESCKTTKNTTIAQLDILTEVSETHDELASCKRNRRATGRQVLEEFWENTTKRLNSVGPPVRQVNEWKKILIDFKRRTKEKEDKIQAQKTKTNMSCESIHNKIDEIFDDDTVSLKNQSNATFGCNSFVKDATDDECDNASPLNTNDNQASTSTQHERDATLTKLKDAYNERVLMLLERQSVALERQAAATEAILEMLKELRNTNR